MCEKLSSETVCDQDEWEFAYKVSDGNLGPPLILVYKITNMNKNLNQTVPMDGGILKRYFPVCNFFRIIKTHP